MPKWQELLEMLQDRTLTPTQIYVRLGLCPAQVQRMLAGKRLRARLAAVQEVAVRRASDRVLLMADQTVDRLAELVASDEPEVARKACIDMMAVARQAALDRLQLAAEEARPSAVRPAEGRISGYGNTNS